MEAKYAILLLGVGIDPKEAADFAVESGGELRSVAELHKRNRTGQFELQIDFKDRHNDFRSFLVGDMLKHILEIRRTAKIPVYDQESDQ